MIRKFTYPIACMSIFFFISCEEFLTHDHPTGVTDDDWWKTEQNAKAALDDIYLGLDRESLVNPSDRLVMNVGKSDEGISNVGQATEYVHGLHQPGSGITGRDWQRYYQSIRKASRYIEHVDNAYMTDNTLKVRYKAEARALRAYFHIHLFTLWGGVPIVDHAITPDENQLSRNTEDEVYDFIISELNLAAADLPPIHSAAEGWRFSSAACWALASRVALFHHRFEDAVSFSKKVIDLNVYQLHTNYATLFNYDGNNQQNPERILFGSERSARAAWVMLAPKSLGGSVRIAPTNVAVNNYETKQGKTIFELGPDSLEIYKRNPNYNNNRDPRLTASVLLPGDVFGGQLLNPFDANNQNPDRIGGDGSTFSGYWIKKYLDVRDRQGTRTLDFILMRYAEVLLNYVEGLIEAGRFDDPDVLKYTNMIRERAGMPKVDATVYNSQSALRELIRRERQAELAFEGHRFFDIRRWGIANEVMNGPVYGATDPVTGITYEIETRKYNPNRDVRYPIPQNEMVTNPNMVQNPGY